jgi:hypothetical protein
MQELMGDPCFWQMIEPLPFIVPLEFLEKNTIFI